MPDVHLPRLEDDGDAAAEGAPDRSAASADASAGRSGGHSKSLLKIGLEVLLISAGVFLGLMGEQWRERTEHRELAQASLRRFRTELQTNRNAVAAVKDKHVTKLKDMAQFFDAYFKADPQARLKIPVPDTGTDPAFMEHAAWDLALATQSLAYIDSDLAFAIAHVYAAQEQLDTATRAVTQAMYSATDGLLFMRNGLVTYWGDCTLHEPRLLTIYDEILPRIDRALGK